MAAYVATLSEYLEVPFDVTDGLVEDIKQVALLIENGVDENSVTLENKISLLI